MPQGIKSRRTAQCQLGGVSNGYTLPLRFVNPDRRATRVMLDPRFGIKQHSPAPSVHLTHGPGLRRHPVEPAHVRILALCGFAFLFAAEHVVKVRLAPSGRVLAMAVGRSYTVASSLAATLAASR